MRVLRYICLVMVLRGCAPAKPEATQSKNSNRLKPFPMPRHIKLVTEDPLASDIVATSRAAHLAAHVSAGYLWTVTLPNGKSERLLPVQRVWEMVISKDGRRVAWREERKSAGQPSEWSAPSTVYVYDKTSGVEMFSIGPAFRNLGFSSDGRCLCFRDDTRLFLLDLEKTTLKPLFPKTGRPPDSPEIQFYPGDPKWSPDGKWILVNLMPEGGFASVSAGVPYVIGLSGEPFEVGKGLAPSSELKTWSADGKLILFHAEQLINDKLARGGFWIFDLSTRKHRAFDVKERSDHAQKIVSIEKFHDWSPDNQEVLMSTGVTLFRVRVEDGRVLQKYSLDKIYQKEQLGITNAYYSPNGQHIAVCVNSPERSDIILISRDGESRRNLTEDDKNTDHELVAWIDESTILTKIAEHKGNPCYLAIIRLR